MAGIPPIIVGNNGPRNASPEEIIKQGVRLFCLNMIKALMENHPTLAGKEPPDRVVDAYTTVVMAEVDEAMRVGFDKAVTEVAK